MTYQLLFGGKDLTEFGIAWDGKAIFEKPAAVYNRYEIPRRNGDLMEPGHKFENVPIAYNCYISKDYRANLSNLVNYLNSFETYTRLENSYEDDVYRMAVFHSAISPENDGFALDGWVTLTFDCKPQEFYKSGETFQTIQNSSSTVTGNPVTVENPSGLTALTGLNVDIEPVQDLNGYDHPWAGGAGKNKLPTSTTKTSNGVTFTVNSDGTLTATRTATSTNNAEYDLPVPSSLYGKQVVLNGCPSGGADSGTYRVFFLVNGSRQATDYGNGVTYTIPSSPTSCVVRINVFKDFNSTAIFKPMIRLASVSDATYAPYENICPITGHTSATVTRAGKNLMPRFTSATPSGGLTYSVNDDGEVTVTGTNTSIVFYAIKFTLNAGTYILTGAPSGGQLTIRSGQAGGAPSSEFSGRLDDYGSGATFTVSARASAWLNIRSTAGTHNQVYKPMIRLASETDPTYEPYTGNTYTIDLSGTCYGGTLDVLTGVLTVNRLAMDMGDMTWSKATQGYFNSSNINSTVKRPPNYTTLVGLLCSCYKEITSSEAYNNTDVGIAVRSSNGNVWVYDPQYETAADFRTAVTGQTICYELATPITVQLTAQQVSLLTGTNIISTDMENTEVTISEPFMLENPSYMKAKPVFKVKVPSKVSINGEQVIDAFGMLDWAETPITPGELSWQVFDGYVRIQGTQSTDFERYIAYLTVPPGTYSIKLNGGDYRSLVQLKIDDGTTEASAFINTDYTFTATEKTEYVLSIFIQSYTQVNDDFTLTFDGQTEYMYINSELMDAYYEDGKNANPYVELSEGFIELPSGETYITVEGEAEIMPNWWRL